MNLLTVQNRINELMSKFVTQIKGATAMGRTVINRVSKTILIPLFVELYGYKNLKNLLIPPDFVVSGEGRKNQ
jgi:hypothetical protein